MSFMNKLKGEFEQMSLGGRSPQEAPPGGANYAGYAPPTQPPSGYHPAGPQAPNSYPNQYPIGQGASQQPQQTHWPSTEAQSSYPYGHQGHEQYQQSVYPPGGQAYNSLSQQQPPLTTSPAPPYSGYQYDTKQPNIPPNTGVPFPHAPPRGSPGVPCPTPPKWVPFWSEQHHQWYYVETTGRGCWDTPTHLPPLPAMPAYPSANSTRGQGLGDESQKKSSSHTLLAGAGGLAAGGVAGYLIHDVLDKRKKKKKHGTTKEDFDSFAAFPPLEANMECDICEQYIFGPYAHCKKCNGGDFDICRDCLSQGATCDGKGKHHLVKVFPQYLCNVCDQLLRGDFYHCSICDKGDWDVCQACLDRGRTCNADGGHQLTKLYIPVPKFGGSGSSSDSD